MLLRNAAIGAAIIAGIAAWYAFRPERLFINKTVNESFAAPAAAAATVDAGVTTTVASGRFHSGAHETSGQATIYTLPNGNRVLRLTDFATSNGPDVHVYLVAADDAKDNETVTRAGFIDLGSIKGNRGDQNYDVPADVDLAKYGSVTIWCKRFSVNFGTAPLRMAAGTSASQVPAGEPAKAATAPAAPAASAALLAGAFHSGAHETKGTATVYRLADGRHVLRLTDFATSNGPDVHVYLVNASDATDNESVTRAGYVDLSPIKGNRGDQNYEIPANVDLMTYRAVTIWCKRFGVNFGTAPLTESRS